MSNNYDVLAVLDARVVLAHLELHGREVAHVREVLRVLLNRLRVALDGLRELLLLVELVAALLGRLRRLLLLALGELLLRQVLVHGLRGRRLLRRTAAAAAGGRHRERLVRVALVRVLGHVDVQAHELAEHRHHARVRQVRVELGRVALDLLELGEQLGVAQERREARVRRHLVEHLGAERVRERVEGRSGRRRLLSFANLLEPVEARRVAGLHREPALVGGDRVVVAAQRVQRRTLARVALGPVALERDAGVGVRERLRRVVHREVRGRAVGEEHVVVRVELDGLRVARDRLLRVARAQRRVALGLPRVRL